MRGLVQRPLPLSCSTSACLALSHKPTTSMYPSGATTVSLLLAWQLGYTRADYSATVGDCGLFAGSEQGSSRSVPGVDPPRQHLGNAR